MPDASGAAQAIGGGQSAAVVVGRAPAAFRAAAETAVHNAAAHGLSATFLLAGVLGVLAGAGIPRLLHPTRAPGRHSVDSLRPAAEAPVGEPELSAS